LIGGHQITPLLQIYLSEGDPIIPGRLICLARRQADYN